MLLSDWGLFRDVGGFQTGFLERLGAGFPFCKLDGWDLFDLVVRSERECAGSVVGETGGICLG